jgi:hypothetical protein
MPQDNPITRRSLLKGVGASTLAVGAGGLLSSCSSGVGGADAGSGDAMSVDGLPRGVTLHPIDGGPDYYSDHGFRYAHKAGWDDPSFFPVGLWYCEISDEEDLRRWRDLSFTASWYGSVSDNMSLLGRHSGIWAIVGEEGTQEGSPIGAQTVGLMAYDEPPSMAAWQKAIKTVPNAIQDGRFWWVNFTWDMLYYQGVEPNQTSAQLLRTETPSPSGRPRFIDIMSADIYWFNESQTSGGINECALLYGPGYGKALNLTADQVGRGCHYGDMVDLMRSFQAPPGTRPILQFVENGYSGNEEVQISQFTQPDEMNWGIWSSIIHGARAICYFNDTFAAGPGSAGAGFDNFANKAFYDVPHGSQKITIYRQAKLTNRLIKRLAPVINSPTAHGYAKVHPPATVLSESKLDSGIECMAKYYAGSGPLTNGFYLFCDTRESRSATDILATFTTVDRYSGPVKVINENRTIMAANGVFTDTFATGATVHIYSIPYG